MIADPKAPLNIRGGGWCQDWPSGNSFLAPLLHSEGSANDAYFDEPEVDAEIERISRLPIDEQPAEWGTLDQTVMTDYFPAVITAYDVSALPYGTRIGGMRVDTLGGMPTWKDIHILQ